MLIVILLDSRGSRPSNPDPISPHHYHPFFPMLVQKGCPHSLAVFRTKFEDMPNFNSPTEEEGAFTARAGVSLFDKGNILHPGNGKVPGKINIYIMMIFFIRPGCGVDQSLDTDVSDYLASA